jgi:hypothetical protein
MLSETSVLDRTTWYKVQEAFYNKYFNILNITVLLQTKLNNGLIETHSRIKNVEILCRTLLFTAIHDGR